MSGPLCWPGGTTPPNPPARAWPGGDPSKPPGGMARGDDPPDPPQGHGPGGTTPPPETSLNGLALQAAPLAF